MAKRGKKASAATDTTGRDLLGEAVNATKTNQPLMATQAEMAHLVNDPRGPLVEFNAQMAQGDKIAFRATELGVNVYSNPTPAPAPAPVATWGSAPVAAPAQAPAAKPKRAAAPVASGNGQAGNFKFAKGVPMPSPRRGGRGSTVYGFEHMDIGDSFFIEVTDENPNPAKRVASTVSSASTRLEPWKFMVRSVTADDTTAKLWNVPVGTKGAGVWRTG